MRSARLAATVADKALRDDDLSQASFAPYVEGHHTEIAQQVAGLRMLLANFRNRELLHALPRRPGRVARAARPDRRPSRRRARNAMTSSTTTITPVKFAHVVFRTPDLDRLVEWYCTVLNAHVAMKNDFIAFLTYDDEHHRVAMVLDPRITETDPAFGASRRRPRVVHLRVARRSRRHLRTTEGARHRAVLDDRPRPDHVALLPRSRRQPGRAADRQLRHASKRCNEYFRSGAFNENPIGTNIEVERPRRPRPTGTN